MNLREVVEAVGHVVAPELAAGFTGRISFELDLRQGNVCKCSVRKEHDLRAKTSDNPPMVERGIYREDGIR